MRHAIGILLLGCTFSASALADKYQIDPSHSSVEFKIRHLMSKVKGTFGTYNGEFDFDPKKPETSKFNVKIEAASINTANEDRDKHLRNADFFDVEKYKDITFTSRKIESAGNDNFKIHGDLTMKGKSCPIVIDAKYLGEVKDPWGNTKAGFEGKARVNRQAWDVVWNKPLVGDKQPEAAKTKDSCELNKNLANDKDGAGLVLGTVIDIDLHIEAENLSKKNSKS